MKLCTLSWADSRQLYLTLPNRLRQSGREVRPRKQRKLRHTQTYTTTSHVYQKENPVGQSEYVRDLSKIAAANQAQQVESDKAFFTDLLSSAATKRDARAFLSRLRSPSKTKPAQTRRPLIKPQVNLGNLYRRSRAVEQSPVFSQSRVREPTVQEQEIIHVAIVKLGGIEDVPAEILDGIAETLSQLNRLSTSPCIVLGHNKLSSENERARVGQAVNRLLAAVGEKSDAVARRIDNVFSTTSSGDIKVHQRELLLRPLRRGSIPIVTTLAYSIDEQKMVVVPANEAVLALVKEFAGLTSHSDDKSPAQYRDDDIVVQMQKEISVDRLITIDNVGGVPVSEKAGQRHVFLNLEQEYQAVRARLDSGAAHVTRDQVENLDLLQRTLQLLPPTSSGLMTTFEEAANLKAAETSSLTRVGTRRQKNALIHNLLTDKPAYSSSLPTTRLNQASSHTSAVPISHSTFVKRGMPITILPDTSGHRSWQSSGPRLTLTDSRLDLARLVHLIEDSFGRQLDVEHYLRRVNDRLAGVIIAGNYEGGAILTWENPVGSNPSAQPVPYLDKFAVLRRSQGAGGVADIVFNAMVHDCFPNGVCWRSRKDNPVNKWYFERSRGTWKIPSTNWTMFWTTPGVEVGKELFTDYESVCRSVMPSWADKKKAAD